MCQKHFLTFIGPRNLHATVTWSALTTARYRLHYFSAHVRKKQKNKILAGTSWPTLGANGYGYTNIKFKYNIYTVYIDLNVCCL
jgi:hypothetical protein